MPVLGGRPKFAIIKEPKGDSRLEGFSAGSAKKWERDVNNLVKSRYDAGLAGYPRLKMMAMTTAAGDVLGVCGWHPKQPQYTPPGKQMVEPPYIYVIGVAEQFRGWRSEAGLRLGSELLVGTLKKIAVQWDTPDMPAVWALVDPKNDDSHNLFERHGFGLIKKETGDHRQYRPYGLPIF
jgi:ribosomal protein S18 acetylase RimI-like enzyme